MAEVNKGANYVIDRHGDKWTFDPKDQQVSYSSSLFAEEESFEDMVNGLIEAKYIDPAEAIHPGDMVIVKSSEKLPGDLQRLKEEPSTVLEIKPDHLVIQISPAIPDCPRNPLRSNCPGYMDDSSHFKVRFDMIKLVEIPTKTSLSKYYESSSGFQTNDDNWKDGLNLLWGLSDG